MNIDGPNSIDVHTSMIQICSLKFRFNQGKVKYFIGQNKATLKECCTVVVRTAESYTKHKSLTLHETRWVHDSMNPPDIKFILNGTLTGKQDIDNIENSPYSCYVYNMCKIVNLN